jgi:hypothetical protein
VYCLHHFVPYTPERSKYQENYPQQMKKDNRISKDFIEHDYSFCHIQIRFAQRIEGCRQ